MLFMKPVLGEYWLPDIPWEFSLCHVVNALFDTGRFAFHSNGFSNHPKAFSGEQVYLDL
jgi:hypothetical protein